MTLDDLRHWSQLNYGSRGTLLKYSKYLTLLKNNNKDWARLVKRDLYEKKAALIAEYETCFDEAKKLTLDELMAQFPEKLGKYTIPEGIMQRIPEGILEIPQAMIQLCLFENAYRHIKLVATIFKGETDHTKTQETREKFLQTHKDTFYEGLDHTFVTLVLMFMDQLNKRMPTEGGFMLLQYHQKQHPMLVDQLKCALQNPEILVPLTFISDQVVYEAMDQMITKGAGQNVFELFLCGEWAMKEWAASMNKYYDQNIVQIHKELRNAYDNNEQDKHIIREAILRALRAHTRTAPNTIARVVG
jgi:hypothetical protein